MHYLYRTLSMFSLHCLHLADTLYSRYLWVLYCCTVQLVNRFKLASSAQDIPYIWLALPTFEWYTFSWNSIIGNVKRECLSAGYWANKWNYFCGQPLKPIGWHLPVPATRYYVVATLHLFHISIQKATNVKQYDRLSIKSSFRQNSSFQMISSILILYGPCSSTHIQNLVVKNTFSWKYWIAISNSCPYYCIA